MEARPKEKDCQEGISWQTTPFTGDEVEGTKKREIIVYFIWFPSKGSVCFDACHLMK